MSPDPELTLVTSCPEAKFGDVLPKVPSVVLTGGGPFSLQADR